uniref:C2H2-type domain-containing protein n=1 Tax=Meloidogyne javanica TaxID=6303 RepID=A0A915LDX6_MELJA
MSSNTKNRKTVWNPAICGASFRLTSELIQHARSNHRQPNRYDRLEGPSTIEEAQKFNKERINGSNERRK